MSTGCELCPRKCSVDRTQKTGYCGAGEKPNIARVMLHKWEEPYISGKRGTGAIFFCGCNLSCVFCQNCSINHSMLGKSADSGELADIMLKLQDEGAESIDLVTPTPHLDTIIPALERAKQCGLSLPVVYNTNAYDAVPSLKRLEGLIDVYLPDLKYVRSKVSKVYSDCEKYFEYAAPAIEEMYRQTGSLCIDENGIARRGLVIRHLVLPGAVPETRLVLDFIAERFPLDTYISLMGQYVPFHRAQEFPPLDRKLLAREYERAVEYCIELGFSNVLVQELDSADKSYTPDFE